MTTVPKLKICGKTDVGRLRDHNEDTISWDAELGIVLLADGMGGHNAGEVASALAVETIQSELSNSLIADPEQRGVRSEVLIRDAIEDANRVIREHAASQAGCAGMGTTVLVAQFIGDEVTLGHVGDSRIYLLRDGRLKQVTTDHSLVQELVENGYLTQEEAQHSVNRNLITRALGIDLGVQVDVQRRALRPGDVFLLCSDGLSDLVPLGEIERTLNEANGDLEQGLNALVDRANDMGGTDNISVILVQVL